MSWGQELNNFTGATASAQQQYKNALKLQKQNQAWQTEMANTAHQREVADLEAAGLNPILSANGGAPTGAPGGGSASTGSPQGNAIDMIGSLVNSLAVAKQTQNNTAKTNADIENETNLVNAQIGNIKAETKATETANKNASTKTKAMENAENLANSWWGRNISPVLADLGQIFGGAGAIANAGASVSNAKTARELAKAGTETATFNKNGIQTGTKRTTKIKK